MYGLDAWQDWNTHMLIICLIILMQRRTWCKRFPRPWKIVARVQYHNLEEIFHLGGNQRSGSLQCEDGALLVWMAANGLSRRSFLGHCNCSLCQMPDDSEFTVADATISLWKEAHKNYQHNWLNIHSCFTWHNEEAAHHLSWSIISLRLLYYVLYLLISTAV